MKYAIIEKVINALPPEDKMRLAKKAKAEKKSIEEMAVIILAEGDITSNN